ncbi:hypothetical protein MSG28_008113 [Choristoneura fumiferana]|uniref:Uncharacterized protein n=1 Tax=Choristoneura fumiferana TaxID=7141 RepID=A0ACC0JA79_CHOFU|nr:hypothetical protein MSG28_008113 [Choristoneura fumiferana]
MKKLDEKRAMEKHAEHHFESKSISKQVRSSNAHIDTAHGHDISDRLGPVQAVYIQNGKDLEETCEKIQRCIVAGKAPEQNGSYMVGWVTLELRPSQRASRASEATVLRQRPAKR